MKIGVLDFETVDPYIGLGLGAGWVYKLWVPTSQFKVIGWGTADIGDPMEKVVNEKYCANTYSEIKQLEKWIADCDYICMHNAPYDLGCLLALGIDIASIKVLDTKIIANLYDNSLLEQGLNFSLDCLSKKYLAPEQQKKKGSLVDLVIKHKLGPLSPITSDEKLVTKIAQKTFHRIAEKWAYSNMDIIQEKDFEGMTYYATQDVIATGSLLLHFLKTISLEQAAYWSSLQLKVVKLRRKGCKIDIKKIKETIPLMKKEVEELTFKLMDEMGILTSVIMDSPKKLATRLTELGYKLPKTPAGGDSTNAKWLKSRKGDYLIDLLVEYRTTKKILNDFFIKPLEMQEYCCPEACVDGAQYGRLFPELNVFGAAATGRASSSHPNEQNIPKRDAKWGKICRAIFLPEDENKQFWVLDYANQEGRLQAHYGALIGAPGAMQMCLEFRKNVMLDLHQKVADLAAITRSQAKPINLGISYGMQPAALAKALGLDTIWKTAQAGHRYEWAGPEATNILNQYHKAVPYIQTLIDKAKENIQVKGFIRTLDGRNLKRSPDGRDYTGISKLIQGSAADLAWKAFIMADDAGIDVKLIIHDEFVIEGTEEDAKRMAEIMEHTHLLLLPMPTEVSYGKNWGELTRFGSDINGNAWQDIKETKEVKNG